MKFDCFRVEFSAENLSKMVLLLSTSQVLLYNKSNQAASAGTMSNSVCPTLTALTSAD